MAARGTGTELASNQMSDTQAAGARVWPARASRRRSLARRLWDGARRWRTFTLGLVLLVLFLGGAIAADLIQPYSTATKQNLPERLQGPSLDHPFGTDDFGRDLFSRILHGSRITMLVGLAAVALSTVIGVPLGLTTGYFGGWYESVVSRLLDALFAFPVLLLAISVVAVLGPGITSATIAIGIAQIPQFARVARSTIVAERERDYVEAARAIGAPTWYIIFRSIVPNTLGPLLVLISLGFAYAVLSEAALAFLGMSTQPPRPSWGSMLGVARRYLFDNPWFAFFPGVAIFLLVFAMNLVGDGLRDLTDPRRSRG
jgi:peptide/nickel transport system permease protein